MGQANIQSLEESLNILFIAKLEVVNIHVVTFKYICNYFIKLNIGGIIAMRKDFFLQDFKVGAWCAAVWDNCLRPLFCKYINIPWQSLEQTLDIQTPVKENIRL